MPESFTVPADGPDIYRCFVIPIPTTENRTVAAVEFRPGNRRVVHHAIMYLDANGAARGATPKTGPRLHQLRRPGVLPTGGLGGWAPGPCRANFPKAPGSSSATEATSCLQMHYHPDGKPETDRSIVGIYFTKSRRPRSSADWRS